MAAQQEVNNATREADTVIDGQIAPGTRTKYLRHVHTFVRYVENFERHDGILELDQFNVGTITAAEMKRFLNHVSVKRTNGPFSAVLIPTKYNTFSYVNQFASAVKYFVKRSGVDISRNVAATIQQFLAGYKRKTADLKLAGLMKMKEGKAAVSFPVYRLLCKKMLEQKDDFPQAIFGHCFLTMLWNLMARSVSAASVMDVHLGWYNDALGVVFPKHKGDQAGESAEPKHVFANPYDATVCPLTAFAIFLFTMGPREAPDGQFSPAIFGQRGAAEKRFSEFLYKVVTDQQPELQNMGIPPHEIGTHSMRKGLITYLCSLVGGPGGIAVSKRAGWSLGMKDRYITMAGGDDQICGRLAAGLDFSKLEFCALPPHFADPGSLLTADMWAAIYPPFSTAPVGFKQALPFLLASFVHHRQWIADNFPQHHPVKACPLWAGGWVDQLAPHVELGVMTNETTGLMATGVTGPHIIDWASSMELP